ncbi:MAG: IS5 family transposase [Alphaproteobacteria bacterium]|nr:IS5 family transposase [Alphaproteobacteria bacterium]
MKQYVKFLKFLWVILIAPALYGTTDKPQFGIRQKMPRDSVQFVEVVKKALGVNDINSQKEAVDARGVPVRCVVTDGVTADCAKAGELIENTGARGLIADRGYDSDKIVQNAENLGMKVVIPPRKNRKVQRNYDKNTYKIRRLVENAFLHLKHWRGIATRYCKNLSSFLASVQIRCLAVWGNIL